MKTFLSTVILFFCLHAAGQKGGTFQKGGAYLIRGTADTLNGIAILNDYENPDTVEIINGKFEFRGEIDKPDMIAIQVPPDYSSRIILEPGTIYVNHSDGEYTFGGAPLNERFQHIEDELKPLNQKIRKYWSAYNKAEGEARIKIWRIYDQAKKDKFALAKQLITKDGTFAGFVESLTVASYEDAATLKHYLDIFDFLSDDRRYKRLHEYYEGVARTAEGVIPPQWTLPDENGNKVSLSDFRGKYVLIDFWYSGCHWCRKMTPGLKDIYQDIKGKGFEIVSISVDPEEDEGKWRKAMEEDGAPWTQVWDKEKSLPPQYSVRGYPTMYFLGPDGKVLEKIRGYHDEPILREIFAKYMSANALAD